MANRPYPLRKRRFSYLRMSDLTFPVCNTCVHNRGNVTCKAFPAGIPNQIISAQSKHNKPWKGQGNDVIYTPEG